MAKHADEHGSTPVDSALKMRKNKRRKLVVGSVVLGLGLASLGGYAALNQTEHRDLGKIETGAITIDKPMQVTADAFTDVKVVPGGEAAKAKLNIKNIAQESFRVKGEVGVWNTAGNLVPDATLDKLKQYITFKDGDTTLNMGGDGVIVNGGGSTTKNLSVEFSLPTGVVDQTLQNLKVDKVMVKLTASAVDAPPFASGSVRPVGNVSMTLAQARAGFQVEYRKKTPSSAHFLQIRDMRNNGARGQTSINAIDPEEGTVTVKMWADAVIGTYRVALETDGQPQGDTFEITVVR